jgi:hypothetical protein
LALPPLKLPLWRRRRNASGLIEGTKTTSGLGDVSAGLSYRLVKESATAPDIVTNVRGKAPTIVGSEANVGMLNLGATFSLSSRLTLLTKLGVGITQYAPDMR